MPNIKSAKKRVLIIEKKTAQNKAIKSRISTYAKKFKTAVAEKDLAKAEERVRARDYPINKFNLYTKL